MQNPSVKTLTAFSLAAAVLIGGATIPALTAASQTAALVRVDIQIVGHGQSAHKLIGAKVVNDRKENIGKLRDIIIGQDNRALFAIVDVSDFLQLKQHLVAVPYESLAPKEQDGQLILSGASRETLKALEMFKYLTS